jgi:hypothetical protein
MPFYWVPSPYPHYRYYPVPAPHRRRIIRTDAEILSDVADALSGDSRIDNQRD